MKRISPTRELRLAFLVGVAGVCVGVAAAQSRHGGGGGGGASRQSAPSYHQQAPGYRQQAPAQGYRQAAPGYRQQARGQQSYMPERYGQERNPAPVERRAAPQQGQSINQGQLGNQGQPMNQGQSSQLAQIERRNPQAQGNGPRGQHLAEWMNQHRNLSAEQQQQALGREPGFHDLPQQTQDRMRTRLSQLNAMNPEQRQRILNYNERMEHLSADQRTDVRNSLQQLGGLPQDQRRQVAKSFRDLRALPPDQRAAALNSPQYQYMNPAQRATLNNLLRVEPLLPPAEQQPR